MESFSNYEQLYHPAQFCDRNVFQCNSEDTLVWLKASGNLSIANQPRHLRG